MKGSERQKGVPYVRRGGGCGELPDKIEGRTLVEMGRHTVR